jgi:hypothetical protein
MNIGHYWNNANREKGMNMEHYWNNANREKHKDSEQNLFQR